MSEARTREESLNVLSRYIQLNQISFRYICRQLLQECEKNVKLDFRVTNSVAMDELYTDCWRGREESRIVW